MAYRREPPVKFSPNRRPACRDSVDDRLGPAIEKALASCERTRPSTNCFCGSSHGHASHSHHLMDIRTESVRALEVAEVAQQQEVICSLQFLGQDIHLTTLSSPGRPHQAKTTPSAPFCSTHRPRIYRLSCCLPVECLSVPTSQPDFSPSSPGKDPFFTSSPFSSPPCVSRGLCCFFSDCFSSFHLLFPSISRSLKLFILFLARLCARELGLVHLQSMNISSNLFVCVYWNA